MNRALAKSVTLGIKAGEIIAVSIVADRCKGIEKRLIQAIGFRDVSNVDGSVHAVYVEVAPVGIVFRQSKVRQYLMPAPSGIAGGRPIVVILRVAAVIGHAIDRAGTAEHLAARGSVLKPQVRPRCMIAAPTSAGTWMKGWRAGPPASSRHTRV